MKETAMKVVTEIDAIMELAQKTLCDGESLTDMVEYMDSTTLELLVRSLKMVKLSKELLIEQAGALDEINHKLDVLMAKS